MAGVVCIANMHAANANAARSSARLRVVTIEYAIARLKRVARERAAHAASGLTSSRASRC
jgi:hypothetical protein